MAGTDGEAPTAQVPQCRHSRGLTILLWRSHQALSHPTTYVPPPPVAGAGFCTGDTRLQSQSHHSCLPVHGARKPPALPGPPCPCRCPCHKDQLPWGHPESPPRCLHDIRRPCPPQTRDHLLLGSGETPASPEPPAAHGPRQPWAEPAPSCRRTQGDTALPSPGSCCVSVSPLLGKGGLLGVQVISALLGWGPGPCSSCRPLGAFSPSGLRGSWAPRPPRGFLCCFFLFPHFSGWTQ